MKSGKGHMEEEEEEEDDEEFGAKKDATSSANNSKDGKSSDKANAIRSKHSVTEQRRRSKINERFQILRELIPPSDQKRDTASFLLEVIQYVQFLQEKVQKYEGSYQPWNSEPTKLMPWRNNHWHAQNFVGQPQTMKNGSGPGSAFPGRFDENSAAVPVTMQPGQPSPVEPDHLRDAPGRPIDPHTELPNKSMSMPLPVPVSMANDGAFSHTLHGPPPSDVQSAECPITTDVMNHQDELTIEGGTIGVSSAYSEGLLTALTQALQSTGVDLSQASVSVQINLGKRANIGATPSIAKDHIIIPTPSSHQPVGTYQDHIIPTPSSHQPVGTYQDHIIPTPSTLLPVGTYQDHIIPTPSSHQPGRAYQDHLIPTPSSHQPVGIYQDTTGSEDLDLAHKRRKI